MKKDTDPAIVACPTCGKNVPFTTESKWRPFCSERCRLIDLGDWINEEHAIPGEEIPPVDANDTNPDDQG